VLPGPGPSAPSFVGKSLGHALFLEGTVDEVASYGDALNEGDAFEQLAESEIEEPALLLAPPVETADADGDGITDGADNCPTVANASQADTDENGIGDACEAPDSDGDGITDTGDNCPDEFNPEQTDSNGDGLGDACVEMPPEADIAAATAITASSATLAGTVNPEGTLTGYQFEYGTTNAYGTKVPVIAPSAGSGIVPVPVNAGITGLAPGTTYHYQLVAWNEFGEVDSEDGMFTTAKAPTATTLPASAIAATGAALNGSVNPEGNATNFQFEYGRTAAYGSKAPATAESAGSGTSPVSVGQALTGLEPNTYYHYRVIATDGTGTVQGADAVFKTSPAALTGSELIAMPVNETFNGTTESMSRFTSDWSALGWATGSPTKGEDTSAGWRPANAFPTEQGAYWHPVLTDTGGGVAALATVTGNPTISGRYLAVWIDMSTPGTTRNGYELRFTETTENASVYTARLSRWQGGVQVPLAVVPSYTLPLKSKFALVKKAGVVSAWVNTGSGYSQILSAADPAFTGGYTGLEGAGNITRLTEFRSGPLPPF